MVTPKVYKDNLKNGIITTKMLADSIYSVSMRAKHHRDMERQYRDNERWKHRMNHYYYDQYDNAQKSAERKEHFYQQKNTMMELLEPTGIHTSIHYKKETIYEYDYEYEVMKNTPEVINHDKKRIYRFEGEISYFDRDLQEHVTDHQIRYINADDSNRLDRAYCLFNDEPVIETVNYIVVNVPRSYDVYLYFECGSHSFHNPVRMGIKYKAEFERVLSEVMEKYHELIVTEVPDLFVWGTGLKNILSSQFTDKVVALIKSGNYVFHQITQEETIIL